MAKSSSFFSGIGKHVSVQPPAALGQNETLRMVQAAQYYPALLSVKQVHSLELKIVNNFCFENLFLLKLSQNSVKIIQLLLFVLI
jgi:hypothetical protein